MIKKLLLNPWTALLTLFLLVGLKISNPTFIESIKLRYFDTLITSKPITENNPVIELVKPKEQQIIETTPLPKEKDLYGE